MLCCLYENRLSTTGHIVGEHNRTAHSKSQSFHKPRPSCSPDSSLGSLPVSLDPLLAGSCPPHHTMIIMMNYTWQFFLTESASRDSGPALKSSFPSSAMDFPGSAMGQPPSHPPPPLTFNLYHRYHRLHDHWFRTGGWPP